MREGTAERSFAQWLRTTLAETCSCVRVMAAYYAADDAAAVAASAATST